MTTPYKPNTEVLKALADDLRFVQDHGVPADTIAELTPKAHRAERYAAALYVMSLLDGTP